MKGSSSNLAIVVDMYLNSINSKYRIVTSSDLGQELDRFKGHFVDLGLALKDLTSFFLYEDEQEYIHKQLRKKGINYHKVPLWFWDSNEDKADKIYQQLYERGISAPDFPLWIDLRGLELDKYLNIKLTGESFYVTASFLDWENNTSFSETDFLGLPENADYNSTRIVKTNFEDALSICFLDVNSNIDTRFNDPTISDEDGRIVLAKIK